MIKKAGTDILALGAIFAAFVFVATVAWAPHHAATASIVVPSAPSSF